MLIGSQALAFWDSSFKVKEDADWDIVGKEKDYESLEREYWVEYHPKDTLNNDTIKHMFSTGVYYKGVEVCSPMGLYLIKRSHLWRELSFDKHITHFHKHLKPLVQGQVPSYLEQEWFNNRLKLTKKKYPQGNPNLNQSTEDFFNDNVKKVYEHDYLHELFAYEDKPMYEKLKYPNKLGSAWCEQELWERLEPHQKNTCVAEECYVIATEKFLVPNLWNYSYKRAYMNALRKVCTTLCSGWFRDHAIDNYPEVLSLFDTERFESVKGILK